MRAITLIIILSSNTICGLAQVVNDTTSASYDKIYLGVTSYSFAYNSAIKSGSSALGISFFMSGKKLIFQLGVLMDFKSYEVYVDMGHGSRFPGGPSPYIKKPNIFVPILLHYKYAITEKTNCFLTAGFLGGGIYYIDTDNQVGTTTDFSYIVGAGVSYKVFKRLYILANPTIRVAKNKFTDNNIIFPGLLINIVVDISYKGAKPL